MPCDTIQTTEIQWGENTNIEILGEALEALGFRITSKSEKSLAATHPRGTRLEYECGSREMSIRGNFDESELRRAYSTKVVERTSKKFGWQLKKTAENKFQALRRF